MLWILFSFYSYFEELVFIICNCFKLLFLLKLLQNAKQFRYTYVSFCCCISTHQYSVSSTSRNVAYVSFCASVQSITQKIFSHSLSQASVSSGVALSLNLAGLCLMKSSIVATRAGGCCGIMDCDCAGIGCIASTRQWIG